MDGGKAAGIAALAMALAAPAAADGHRQAVLALVSMSAALRAEVLAPGEKGMLGIDVESRMSAPECAELLQDLASMRNLQAMGAEAGDVRVRWHGKRELLLRVRRGAAFALEAHDDAGPACTVTRGPGKLTPVLLDLPGMKKGPPQVFVVDPLRSPSREPLK
jgi:hypothetical protein